MLVKEAWEAFDQSFEQLRSLHIDKHVLLDAETHEIKRKMNVDEVFEPASKEVQNAWVGVVER